MKTTKYMVFMVMTLLLAQFASAGLITSGTSLEASLLYYEPVPAQPGDTLDIWIQVSNDGGTASKAGAVTIYESYPFSVESSADKTKEFTSVPPQESFLVKTKVRIDKNANEGTNYLTVRVQQTDSENWIERDLPITISGRSSAISIASARTEPQYISPGSEGVILIELENVGDSLVRNLDVSLDLDDLSITPSTGSDSITLGTLAGGQKTTVSFGIIAYPDAEAGAYQVPLTLSYEDEQGNAESQEKTIGLVIGSEPDMLVYFDRIDVSAESLKGDVVIRFVNKGLSEIKLLEMEVLENNDIEVTSESAIIYVGNIDEDDYESAEISLKVSGSNVDVPLRIAYKDALNRDYEVHENLQLHLEKTNGDSKSSTIGWAVLIVIVIAVGFWLWRRKKNAKRHK